MEDLSLMQKFADPQLVDDLSMIERTQGALITTLMGVGLVVVILALLWLIIAIMTKAIQSSEAKANLEAVAPPVQSAAAATASVPAPVPSEPETVQTDTSLIAVITAAIAASEGRSATENLVIRKINRASGVSTAWGRAGSGESIDSRKF